MKNLFFKIKRRLAHYYLNLVSFETWQKYGYHVIKNYYYSPIPDVSKMTKEQFNKISVLRGIDMRVESQKQLLQRFSSKYRTEYDAFPEKPSKYFDYYTTQTSYRCVEAQILYSFIRDLKPKRMIEIGSGYSTMLSAQAIRKNAEEGNSCEFTAIEPYPNESIKRGFVGLSQLISQPVEQVPLSLFESLEANDILFIDSTHTVRMGGDVLYEILEILPRLSKGVYVHIHDIFLPYEYPEPWLKEQKWFWAEQYLLQAFLQFNETFEIVWASHYMHRTYPELCKAAMKYYEPGLPYVSGFWIKKVK
jgi:hypothetical protein